MKKGFACLLVLGLCHGVLFGQTRRDIAEQYIHQVVESMDHIQIFQSDVEIKTVTEEKESTQNIHLKSNADGLAVAIFKKGDDKEGLVVVQNDHEVVYVKDGESMELENADFPFELPTTFLDQLTMQDVDDNFTFRLVKDGADKAVIDMLPQAHLLMGREPGEDFVSMLRFHLSKDPVLLSRVEIFENYQTKSKDYVLFDYQFIELGSQSFPVLATVESYEYRGLNADDIEKFVLKTTTYLTPSLNPEFEDDVFDADEY